MNGLCITDGLLKVGFNYVASIEFFFLCQGVFIDFKNQFPLFNFYAQPAVDVELLDFF